MRPDPAPPKRHVACPSARRGELVVAVLTMSIAITTAAAASDVELEALVEQSRALCTAADELPTDQRRQILARGLALADAALARDERSAHAHFAVVCNLGKTTGLSGLGLATFGAVYRLRREVDITLTLAPDHPEALAAKGALLLRLPRFLGGDPIEAEHWLRRALAIDPTNPTARAYLAELDTRRSGITPATDTNVR